MLKDLIHYCDLLAVPCFLIAFIYFYTKNNKTLLEIFLMIFVLIGFIADSIFSYNYLTNNI